MSITVGELNVKLNLELQRLDGQISQANAKIKRMSGGWQSDFGKAAKGINNVLGTIGIGLTVGAIVDFAKSVVELGGQITDLSAQADMSTTAFQKISAIAMDSGVSMDDVAKASEHLRAALQTASENGADPLNKRLDTLRVTAAGLKGLKPQEVWELLGNRLAHATDKQAAMNAISDLFGSKIGPKLRGTLVDIADGVDNIDLAGLVIPPDQLKSLDEFGDKFGKIQLKSQVAAAAVFNHWGERFEELGAMAAKFFHQNFKVEKGSFFDEITRDSGQDRSRGPNILPGGMASKLPRALTSTELLEDKADAADAAERRKNKPSFMQSLKNKKELEGKVKESLDLFFGDQDELSSTMGAGKKLNAPSSMKMMNTPGDSFARLGWQTGAVANLEVKTQTSELKKIRTVLQKTYDKTQSNEAVFTN